MFYCLHYVDSFPWILGELCSYSVIIKLKSYVCTQYATDASAINFALEELCSNQAKYEGKNSRRE